MEIEVMQNILGENESVARKNKTLFDKLGIFCLNLMGSPGSGKTSLLEKTIAHLKGELRIAVIEGDLFTDKDAARIEGLGIPVLQINTAGGCHLDAAMVQKAASKLNLSNIDLLIVENVGNLVCPAEFDLGEDAKALVFSVTEGEDKPMKYPLIFKESAITIINKIDLAPYTSFDLKNAKDDIMTLNPKAVIREVSCVKGTGLDEWFRWLKEKISEKKHG